MNIIKDSIAFQFILKNQKSLHNRENCIVCEVFDRLTKLALRFDGLIELLIEIKSPFSIYKTPQK